MGDTRAETKRRRAVGTRDRIVSHLARAGAVYDENGMASAMLAREVGYPGSSVAFAQLLSGMERSGLIERDVRGKRTYRISATPDAAAAQANAVAGRRGAGTAPGSASTGHGLAGTGQGTAARVGGEGSGDGLTDAGLSSDGLRGDSLSGDGDAVGRERSADPSGDFESTDPSGDFDYDELARRLLVEVVRRLAAVPAEATRPPAAAPAEDTSLEHTVAGLEQELASARITHGTLTEENAKLRQQLQAARHSLALARRSAGQPVAEQLDAAEVSLLERLLTHSAESTRNEDTG
jgi:hypothetical protein